MTMANPVTGWFEQQQLYGSPTAYRCQAILDSVWLARYPRPGEIGFDNGGEFKSEFKLLCNNMHPYCAVLVLLIDSNFTAVSSCCFIAVVV